MHDCQHEKLYSSTFITSKPTECHWECKKCGYQGVDIIEVAKRNKYTGLVEGFSKQTSATIADIDDKI